MPFHKIANFLHVLFSERLEIEKLAVKWCIDNKIESTPFNIITALYSLGYIRKHPLHKELGAVVAFSVWDDISKQEFEKEYVERLHKDLDKMSKQEFEKEYMGSWHIKPKEEEE